MGANGKTEASELVARCQAVGWQVVKTTSGHWRVDTRRGAFTVSSTPSDSRSVKNSLAEARRYGLETLEEKLKERLDRERLQKLEDDRKLNNAKLARMQTENGVAQITVPAATFQPPADPTIDLGYGFVNKIAIAAIAPAMVKTPVMDKAVAMAGAEELLLADGTVVYRCVRRGPYGKVNNLVKPGELCHAIFDSVVGLRTHIAHHTTRAALDAAEQTETLERSTEIVAKTQVANTGSTSDQVRAALTESLTAQVKAIDAIGASVIELRNITLGLVDQVKNVKTEVIVQEPDPELVAKARNWDALQTLRKQQEDLLGGKSA